MLKNVLWKILRAKAGDSVVPSYFSVLFVNEHCSICIPCMYQTNHSCLLLSLSLSLSPVFNFF